MSRPSISPAPSGDADPPPTAELPSDAGLPARTAALEILQDVLRRDRSVDDAIDAHETLCSMELRDRSFVRLLLFTALRRLGQLDALIAHCLDRPLPARAATVHDILRLGTCQTVFLGVAAHAAVDQMVTLTEQAGHARLKGLVNAVLRRIAREGTELAAAQDAPRLNTPDWLWRVWSETYGADLCQALAAAHLEEAPLDLTVRKDPDVWAEHLSATLLPTGSLRRRRAGLVTALAGYDEGAWWVQDAAAALPARLFGDVAGGTVIDLCAAPGGKTAQLAAAGAHVIAVDRSAARLRRLDENLTRLGLAAERVCADAAFWRPPAPAPFVLLDAPCTATGTIRRHPEIQHRRTPADTARMAALQSRLLVAAVEMTAPGGLLVFATCSLQPEEGPEQITALLAAGAPVVREPIRPEEVGGLGQIVTPEGDLRTLPCHLSAQGGLDGFYAARLRRR